MADVTTTVHVRVSAFDPAQRALIPVPGAGVLVEDRGWLWDPDLSTGSDTTDASGLVAIPITYDDAGADKLNPYFTVSVPAGVRSVPAGADADHTFTLPDEWQTRHYVTRRARNILDHADPGSPLEIFVGLPAHLRVAYSDFDASGRRNPFALPEHTARVHLADYDTFLFIDFLNPDDTLTGVGYDIPGDRIVPAGDHDAYPYCDLWPTAPCALDGDPGPDPRAWTDPPRSPVGTLGGGSFDAVGPVAVDGHGFVFMVDGGVVRRFYPDGTLCETIPAPPSGAFSTPGGLALDRNRTLFVADTGNDRVVVYTPDWLDGGSGRYVHLTDVGSTGTGPRQFDHPAGLCVVPNRVVDGAELLAVADPGNHRVQVFGIDVLGADSSASLQAQRAFSVGLSFVTQFGAAGSGAGQFQEPVGVSADRDRRLFVCDRQLHRVSRWTPNGSATTYTHDVDWEKSGGGSGGGDGEFDTPEGIAVDVKNRTVYVAESGNGRVQRLDADSGAHLVHWIDADIAALAGALVPRGVAADARGDVYVADGGNGRVVRATPFDLDGTPRADGDAPRVVASPWTPRTEPDHMRGPAYVAFAPDGALWVSDTGNDRVLVYALHEAAPPDAPVVVTDGLAQPAGIAFAPDGAAFVVDAGNDRVLPFDASRAPQTALGASGSGAGQFSHPAGVAYAQRATPLLLVADRGNDRVQVLQADGTFLAPITTDGTTALSAPEDVAVNDAGQVFVADTANGRIVRFALQADGTTVFERAFPVPSRAVPVVAPSPSGVAWGPDGFLLVTDRAQEMVFRLSADGDLDAHWDLRALLGLSAGSGGAPDVIYRPELARQVLLSAPARAVLNDRGVMAIADAGHDRVRLVRVFSDIRVELFDLGEGLPDISLRAITKNDWRADLGLELNVGDVSIFDESQDFETEPEDDFSGDRYERWEVIRERNGSNAAINVMRLVRLVQTWYREQTRQDDADHRWGTSDHARTLNVDLIASEGSYQFLDVNMGERSPDGRGSDAWDDPVVAHEMTHWVFFKALEPYPPFTLVGLIDIGHSHTASTISSFNQALTEGWANYVELFWGSEFSSTDRVRGFPMAPAQGLTGLVPRSSTAWRHLFGGSTATTLPSFDDPERGLENEGYFANTLYQLHRALTDPGVVFADSPAYWHHFNTHVTDAASERYANTIWEALRRFDPDPPTADLDHGTAVYLRNVLAQFHAKQSAFAEIAQSIFALNNQLMPLIAITEGTSTTTPGTAIGPTVTLAPGDTRDLIIQVTDATGAPLAAHNLHLVVGDTARYALVGGPPPIHHGRRRPASAPPSTTDLYRATNVNGIVRVQFTAPALPSGATSLTDTLRVEYQPDFDTDATFDPPEKGDDRETTLRRLYLYELRGAAKTWAGAGQNFGATVSTTLTFEVSS